MWQGGQLLEGRTPRCRRGLFNSLTQDCGLLHLDRFVEAGSGQPCLASPMETLSQLRANRQIYTEALGELGLNRLRPLRSCGRFYHR